MQNNLVNRQKEKWVRPWEIEAFDDLYNRDERFFAIIIKGAISWLNRNIMMYNKPINHFIFNTGSSYMYIESNGYKFSWKETSGEDQIYMHLPRCIINLQNLSIPTEELTSPYARGTYERRNGENIQGFNSEIKRIPIEIDANLEYTLSNFNERIVLIQEIIDKLIFQKYFQITYLGKQINCSIEFTAGQSLQTNKIDLTSPETNVKTMELPIKICTNYPIINEHSEISTNAVISEFNGSLDAYDDDPREKSSTLTDKNKYTVS